MSAQQFADALDPQRFVERRNGLGGAAAEATGALIEDLKMQLQKDREWQLQAQNQQKQSEDIRKEIIQNNLA